MGVCHYSSLKRTDGPQQRLLCTVHRNGLVVRKSLSRVRSATPQTVYGLPGSLSMDSPRQNTGEVERFLLPGDLPDLGLNLGLLHLRQSLNRLSYEGSPGMEYWWITAFQDKKLTCSLLFILLFPHINTFSESMQCVCSINANRCKAEFYFIPNNFTPVNGA